MKKRIGAIFAMFALVICLPITAFAASAFDGGNAPLASSEKEYNAGNLFVFGAGVTNVDVENDLYWFGATLDATKLDIGKSGHGSLIAAGSTASLKNIKVADSLRIAAHDIEIFHSEVGNNVTIAARNINVGNEMSANGIYAAAETLTIAGSYKGGVLTGNTVNFNGVVDGDLTISAQNIQIGSNAQVKGTLFLPTGSNISIAEGASADNVSYTTPVQANEPTLFDDLLSVLYALMAHIILVGLFFVLIRNSLVNAANMVRPKLGKMILAGLVALFAAPIVCIMLLFPLVTIPVAVLLMIVMVVIALFSIPFAGSALGMSLFGNRMNPVLAAIIGTAVLTVLAYIPFVSFFTVVFCIVFTAGYLWMRYWENHQERRRERLAARQALTVAQMNGSASAPSVPPMSSEPFVPTPPSGSPVSSAPPAPPAESTPAQPDPSEPSANAAPSATSTETGAPSDSTTTASEGERADASSSMEEK